MQTLLATTSIPLQRPNKGDLTQPFHQPCALSVPEVGVPGGARPALALLPAVLHVALGVQPAGAAVAAQVHVCRWRFEFEQKH